MNYSYGRNHRQSLAACCKGKKLPEKAIFGALCAKRNKLAGFGSGRIDPIARGIS
jgi:hypothetical protein